MRPETKKLIQEKLHRWLEGEQTHAIDPNGNWINVRDIRSIIDCETVLLKATIEKQKQQLIFAEEIERQMQVRIEELMIKA